MRRGPHDSLSDSDIRNALTSLPEWNLSGNAIQRVFEFSDFVHAMEFVNQVAEEAEEANHHPDITSATAGLRSRLPRTTPGDDEARRRHGAQNQQPLRQGRRLSWMGGRRANGQGPRARRSADPLGGGRGGWQALQHGAGFTRNDSATSFSAV